MTKLNLSNLSSELSNDILEYTYKSLSVNDKTDDLWRPVESVVIRRIVEIISKRGTDRLNSIQSEFLKFAKGSLYNKAKPQPAPMNYEAWTKNDLDLVKLYLESLPPSQWTVDDYMLSVDYLVHKYLPVSDLAKEAEWMSVRSSIMGKVQANLDKEPTVKQADKVLSKLPSTLTDAFYQFNFSDGAKAALMFGKVRAVENVVSMSGRTRHSMKQVVIQHLESKFLGGPNGKFSNLEQNLSETFATLNRDWRRIAITEAGECMNQGLIANLSYGSKVRRIEMYNGACSFCSKINNLVATVVDPNQKIKDPNTMVWVGKNNIGRSASPNKRVGSMLIKRTPDEMWTVPGGLVHPNCRGRWMIEPQAKTTDDPKFAKWLTDILG